MEGQRNWRTQVSPIDILVLMALIEVFYRQVCYSFWVLASLSMLKKVHYIDSDKLISFILSAQVGFSNAHSIFEHD